jgi:hypothetical protein
MVFTSHFPQADHPIGSRKRNYNSLFIRWGLDCHEDKVDDLSGKETDRRAHAEGRFADIVHTRFNHSWSLRGKEFRELGHIASDLV